MSLGRAASSTSRHAGVGGIGRETPWRHAPAANGSLPSSPVSLCCPGGRRARVCVSRRLCQALG